MIGVGRRAHHARRSSWLVRGAQCGRWADATVVNRTRADGFMMLVTEYDLRSIPGKTALLQENQNDDPNWCAWDVALRNAQAAGAAGVVLAMGLSKLDAPGHPFIVPGRQPENEAGADVVIPYCVMSSMLVGQGGSGSMGDFLGDKPAILADSLLWLLEKGSNKVANVTLVRGANRWDDLEFSDYWVFYKAFNTVTW